MKKIKNYSTQYKIIQPTQLHTQLHNQNQNHAKLRGKNSSKSQSFTHKKTLSKDRQEFINNISASGFKQFNL